MADTFLAWSTQDAVGIIWFAATASAMTVEFMKSEKVDFRTVPHAMASAGLSLLLLLLAIGILDWIERTLF